MFIRYIDNDTYGSSCLSLFTSSHLISVQLKSGYKAGILS